MPLSREDKRLLIGLGVALGLLVIYHVAVRGPLRSAIADRENQIRELQPQIERHFRKNAEPAAEVERTLAAYQSTLAERLNELRSTVEFDPDSLLDPLDAPAVGTPAVRLHSSAKTPAGAASRDAPSRYLELSRKLDDRLKAARDKQPHPTRIPRLFDPQGAPAVGILSPLRGRRQLAMAYRILRSAIETRVDVLELRTVLTRSESPAQRYLEKAQTTIKAQSTLDELAAFIHALSTPRGAAQPGTFLSVGPQPSSFLSVGRLEITRSEENPDMLQSEITLVAVRARPHVTLVREGDETADERP
jgi:hypothetical protein